ncbi:MAG: hypothetical protein HZB65_02105 [Candidatus Aenigmarchaeota archaeon]|nr:hypothetical protein [Candidatus Aenigmarchaeota archaeon]
MGIFSYLRFGIGLLLAIEIIRSALFDGVISSFAISLSIILIILGIWFFVGKFAIGN